MVRHILVLALIIYISSFYTIVFNVAIGRTIPLAYITLILTAFIASLIGKLSYFKYILIIFVLASLVCLLYLFINKKRDIRIAIRNIINPSLIIYIIFFTYLRLELKNVEFNKIDDLHCYAIKLNDMLKTDTLFNSQGITPYGDVKMLPFNVLLSYVFVKLYGRLNDFIAILGVSSFCFSFLLRITDKYELKLKNLLKIVLSFLVMVAITLMIQNNISIASSLEGFTPYLYTCIYRDWIMSFSLAYGFYSIYSKKNDDIYVYIEISMCTCTLAMTKDLGIALALLLWVTFYINLALEQKSVKIGKEKIRNFILISLLIPLAFYVAWNIKKNIASYNFEINSVQVETETVESAIDTSYRVSTFKAFVNEYFNGYTMSRPIKISYFFATLILTAALVLIVYLKKQDKTNYLIPIMYFLGSIGYALALLIAYCFFFGIYESVNLSQVERYMESYTYAGLIYLYMVLISEVNEEKYLLALIVVSILLVEPESIDTLIYNSNRINLMENQREGLRKYFEYEFDDKEMIFFNQSNYVSNMMIEYLAEDKTEYITYALPLPQDTTVEKFIELIKDKEYIFVGTYDSMLENLWHQVTDTEIYNYTIYWVHENEDGSFNIEYKVSYDNK